MKQDRYKHSTHIWIRSTTDPSRYVLKAKVMKNEHVFPQQPSQSNKKNVETIISHIKDITRGDKII